MDFLRIGLPELLAAETFLAGVLGVDGTVVGPAGMPVIDSALLARVNVTLTGLLTGLA